MQKFNFQQNLDLKYSLKSFFQLAHKVDAILFHGRGDWLGCWDKFVQKAHFNILVCLRLIK